MDRRSRKKEAKKDIEIHYKQNPLKRVFLFSGVVGIVYKYEPRIISKVDGVEK